MRMPDASEGEPTPGGFDVVPVVISEYLETAWPELPGAEDEAQAIGTLFGSLGGEYVSWEIPPHERDLSTVNTRLMSWAKPPRPRSSVLLWLGHGASNHDRAELVIRGPAGTTRDHPVEPAMVSRHVADEERRRAGTAHWAIVIVEACGAARFVQRVAAELLQDRAVDGVLVIGSGSDQGSGYLATFRRVLEQVLASYTDNDTRITLGDLGRRIGELLPMGYVFPGRLAGAAPLERTVELHSITAPVDVYHELRTMLRELPPHERAHFATKGMGADLGEFGWYFVGRKADRTAILEWLRTHENGLFVVAGPAGSGKSALLGNILLHAQPNISHVLARTGRVGDAWPVSAKPPPIDASVLFTGASADEVVDQLAVILRLELPLGTVAERRAALVASARGRRADPVTVLADGLDETLDPLQVSDLLRELTAAPGVRIVVGTRPETNGPYAMGRLDLIEELGSGAAHVSIRHIGHDSGAITQYVARRLADDDGVVRTLGTDVSSAVDRATELIAATPAGEPPREFLHARLAVREILADPGLLRPARHTELANLIGLDRDALFARALARMERDAPQARSLLAALAFAQGRGLPRADGLWAQVAGAVDGSGSGGEVRRWDESDVDKVLAVAGPYIMLDSAHGQSVFRLAHRTFHDHYLAKPDARAKQLTVLTALLAAGDDLPGLNSYLQEHLSGHAAAAGADGWLALAEHPDLLDRLELRSVVADVLRAPGRLRQLPANVLGTFVSGHLIGAGSPADRRGLRQLGSARAVGRWRDEPDGDPTGGSAWELRSARLRTHPPHLTLDGHIGAVRDIAVLPSSAGAALFATGGDDGHVRLWHATRARLVRTGLAGSSGVTALGAYVAFDESLRFVTLDADAVVTVRDAADGTVVGNFTQGLASCIAVFTGTDGGPNLAIGTRSGELWLWDPERDGSAERLVTGHVGAITAVCPYPGGDGLSCLATAGRDRTVRLWNPVLRRRAGPVCHGHSEPIRAMAGAPSGMIVTGGDDGTVICWDPVAGRQIADPVTPHEGQPVTAVATMAGQDGSDLVITAGGDGTLRVWDPRNGHAVGPALTGHRGPVHRVVTFPDAEGVVRLATGADDGTVRIWDLDPNPAGSSWVVDRSSAPAPPAEPVPGIAVAADGSSSWHIPLPGPAAEEFLITARVDGTVRVARGGSEGAVELKVARPSGPVRSAAVLSDGPGVVPLLATGDHDGVVRVWNSGTGERHGPELSGHVDWVTAMLAVELAGQRLLVTGGDDRTLRVWKPGRGEPLHTTPLGLRVRSLSVEPSGGADVDVRIGSDEGVLVVRLLVDWFADSLERGGGR
jgi:WD40 repeat protein